MNIREENIKIFEDTLNQINSNEELNLATKKSKSNSILYMNNVISIKDKKNDKSENIQITQERTLESARRFQDVCVLNFASATRVGGGVQNGSSTQEESICRISTLYPCLNQKHFIANYYDFNKKIGKQNDIYCYSNRIIYSKDIIVFKEDSLYPKNLDINERYKVDAITCPAPNLRHSKTYDEKEVYTILKNRLNLVFQIAIANDNKNIILGAFGCGAFSNNPKMVATIFKELLENYRYYFDNIVFAIYTKDDTTNYDAFKEIFQL